MPEIVAKEEWDPTRIASKCWGCKQPQIVVVRLADDGTRTKTRTGACQNNKCFRYVDLKKTSTWVKE